MFIDEIDTGFLDTHVSHLGGVVVSRCFKYFGASLHSRRETQQGGDTYLVPFGVKYWAARDILAGGHYYHFSGVCTNQ